MSDVRPNKNSVLTTVRLTTWWPVWEVDWVAAANLLAISTSPNKKTRSQGTNTFSKNTTASISSNRDPRGWSKLERP